MKKQMVLLLLLLCFICTGCNTVISEKIEADNDATSSVEKAMNDSYTINNSTLIQLSNNNLSITKAGTYILTGEMKDAYITVEVSKDEEVQLVLSGVSIDSGSYPSIYVIEADKVTITLAEGAENTLKVSSAMKNIGDEETDAVIYSKADLTINGKGSLYVVNEYGHGIVSKDDLIIGGGNYSVDANGIAMKGKDKLVVIDGNFEISATKDAMKSDNEEDENRGYVYIYNGNFEINSTGDAIYGYNFVTIENGNFEITTKESTENTSYKGVKSEGLITVNNGVFKFQTADDAIHSNGNVEINSGTYEIKSDDDGIHADAKLVINGGTFVIEAHEGMEATYVEINDGDITIKASDDGINATTKSSDYESSIVINGGTVDITMGDGDVDAIDSNGTFYKNGGTLIITMTGKGIGSTNYGLDWETEGYNNGGTTIINGEDLSDQEFVNQQMGGPGGFGPSAAGTDSNGFGGFNKPDFKPGEDTERPEKPEGDFDPNNKQDFDGQNMFNLPEDFDPENIPDNPLSKEDDN